MFKHAIAAGLVLVCVVVFGAAAQAAEIRVLASNGVKAAIEDLKPKFEKASGDTLSIDFSTAATLRDRIDKGEAFDVAVLTDDAVDALVKSGKLSPATRTELAAVGIGVGYRKGAAKPDVRTGTSLKQALLKAKSIAYTGNGASRPAIDKMIAGLAISHELIANPNGPPVLRPAKLRVNLSFLSVRRVTQLCLPLVLR